MEKSRRILTATLKFYNAPISENLQNKDSVFALALSRKYFMRALCEFLEVVFHKLVQSQKIPKD